MKEKIQARVENVTKRFDEVIAVNDISLQVKEGEFLVLLGPSGSGKTTLLRLLAGLERLSKGNIYISDALVNELPPRNRNIAMVFQNYALYPHMTVFENLGYPLKIRKRPKQEIQKRVREVAETLEIAELFSRKPKQISGGQRQRVALGRAMIRNANLFLMDEPLSNLDAKLRVQMRAELRRLQKTLGTTTVYVTHDQAEAMTLADRVAVINNGVIQQLASPEEIYFHPVNKFVAGFIGSPQMNFFHGIYSNATVKTDYFEYPLPAASKENLKREPEGKHVYLGIRPEDVHVSKTKIETAHSIRAKVYVSELMGAETYVFYTLGADEQFISRTSPDFKGQMDEEIWISFNEERLHMFDSETEETLL